MPMGMLLVPGSSKSQSRFCKSGREQENWSARHQQGALFTAISPKQLSLAEKDPQGPSLLHKELVISSWASKRARLVEALLGGQGPLRYGTERVGVICRYLSSLELSVCVFAYLVFFTSQ